MRSKQSLTKEAIAERARKYNCDGMCYGCRLDHPEDPKSHGMCPAVETCPETCTQEFIATVVATIVCGLLFLSPYIFLIFIIIRILKG